MNGKSKNQKAATVPEQGIAQLFSPTTGMVEIISPDTKDLRDQYPELKNIEEFRDLTKAELFFVNYFANSTTSYYNISPLTNKISACYDSAYLMRTSAPEGSQREKDEFIGGNFPVNIRVAMDRMRMFNPEIRFKGVKMLRQIFDEYESILEEKVHIKQELGEINIEDPEKAMAWLAAVAKFNADFVDTSAKIHKELPALLIRLEDAYGVSMKFSGKKNEMSAQDYFTDMMNQ